MLFLECDERLPSCVRHWIKTTNEFSFGLRLLTLNCWRATKEKKIVNWYWQAGPSWYYNSWRWKLSISVTILWSRWMDYHHKKTPLMLCLSLASQQCLLTRLPIKANEDIHLCFHLAWGKWPYYCLLFPQKVAQLTEHSSKLSLW